MAHHRWRRCLSRCSPRSVNLHLCLFVFSNVCTGMVVFLGFYFSINYTNTVTTDKVGRQLLVDMNQAFINQVDPPPSTPVPPPLPSKPPPPTSVSKVVSSMVVYHSFSRTERPPGYSTADHHSDMLCRIEYLDLKPPTTVPTSTQVPATEAPTKDYGSSSSNHLPASLVSEEASKPLKVPSDSLKRVNREAPVLNVNQMLLNLNSKHSSPGTAHRQSNHAPSNPSSTLKSNPMSRVPPSNRIPEHSSTLKSSPTSHVPPSNRTPEHSSTLKSSPTSHVPPSNRTPEHSSTLKSSPTSRIPQSNPTPEQSSRLKSSPVSRIPQPNHTPSTPEHSSSLKSKSTSHTASSTPPQSPTSILPTDKTTTANPSPLGQNSSDYIPYVIGITPTYYRMTQKLDLTSLCQTLMNVPRLLWIVVEDATNTSRQVMDMLSHCGVESVLLHAVTTTETKKAKQRGVDQRNLAMNWIRDRCKACEGRGICEGVVYFMDDDNTYDIRLFEKIRWTRGVSVFPVGFVAGLKFEGPVCKNGKVESWQVQYAPKRHIPVDMAAFALNVKVLTAYPKVRMGFKSDQVKRSTPGYLEPDFLKSLGAQRHTVECRGASDEILVWHVKSTYKSLVHEKKHPSDPKVKV